jgi:superfamily II DNA or RNA helicase
VSEQRLQELRSALTLHRKTADGGLATFYIETDDGFMHLPRGFGLTEEGARLLAGCEFMEGRSNGFPLPDGTRVQAQLGIPPFPPDQPKFRNAIVEWARGNGHGGLAEAPTRAGKTLCSLDAACLLGGSTLILVDRAELARQWCRDITGLVRDGQGRPAPCGVVRADRCDYGQGFPFVVAMQQTLARRELPAEFRNAFRTVIVDECQSSPCEQIWGALRRVASHYVIGLSGTPDRHDGLTEAITWTIGPKIAKLDRPLHADVFFLHIPWRNCKVDGREVKLVKAGRTDNIAAEKALMADDERVTTIAGEVARAVREGRQVLLLAGLREHIFKLAGVMRKLGLDPGIYIGGRAGVAEMAKNPVLATWGVASKGIDFKPVPTLGVIAGPKVDVRQAAGRVLQPQAPCMPLILDCVDGAPALIRQAHQRYRFYASKRFNIQNEVWP